MSRTRRSPSLIAIYLVTVPLWWALGFDFIAPMVLAGLLVWRSPQAHRYFAPPDHLLLAIIVVLSAAAYLNGFLMGHHTMRLVAALYNLSLWVCGFIILHQVRHIFLRDQAGGLLILRSAFLAFLLLVTIAWGSFIAAYALGDFSLQARTLFGLTLGNMIPSSAALIKQSATIDFARPDWGLSDMVMPRIVVYGPYPTATAAAIAVLGALALLYLNRSGQGRSWRAWAVAGIIVATLAITLTRSIIVGWLLGMIAANLFFGTGWRRILALSAAVGAALLALHGDISTTTQYRAYSTESRFENYDRAVEQTLDSHPVLGLGVKPREEDNHIAVGSHSTFVSSFTKGGTVALSLVIAYLIIVPAYRWLGMIVNQGRLYGSVKAQLRILFNLQVAIWIWACFEDIDAPATAAMLIFLSLAVFDSYFHVLAFRDSEARPMQIATA